MRQNGADGTYNLGKVVQWKLDSKSAKSGKGLSVGGEGLGWEERYKRAQALTRELELKREEGTVIERAEAEDREKRLALFFKNSILGLPAKTAALLYGLEIGQIEAALREQVENILREMVGDA